LLGRFAKTMNSQDSQNFGQTIGPGISRIQTRATKTWPTTSEQLILIKEFTKSLTVDLINDGVSDAQVKKRTMIENEVWRVQKELIGTCFNYYPGVYRGDWENHEIRHPEYPVSEPRFEPEAWWIRSSRSNHYTKKLKLGLCNNGTTELFTSQWNTSTCFITFRDVPDGDFVSMSDFLEWDFIFQTILGSNADLEMDVRPHFSVFCYHV